MYTGEIQESIDRAVYIVHWSNREGGKGVVKEAVSKIYQNVYGNSSRDGHDIYRRRMLAAIESSMRRINDINTHQRRTIAAVLESAMQKHHYSQKDAQRDTRILVSTGIPLDVSFLFENQDSARSHVFHRQ